jgi:hypothetical protein
MEQLDTDIDTISELLDLQRMRVIQWHFVPCTITTSAEPTRTDEIDIYWLASQFCGKQTQRLLPHLREAFRRDSVWPKTKWLRRGLDKTEFRNGGCNILVGRPPISVSRLEKLPTSEIALFPHLTERGPNGIWFLGRGDEHPLVKRANDIRLFCLTGEDKQPIEISCIESSGHEGTMSDLFSSESAAADQAREDEREFETATNVRMVSGKDLLALLSVTDALWLDSKDIPLTFAGQLLLETQEVMDAVEVLETLEQVKDS